jgi:putative endonuclease
MLWFCNAKPVTGKTQAKGQAGEDAAARFLQKQGYRIVERNWRPGNYLRGEIDCIAWHHDERNIKVLCFIEVKTRSSNRMGAPQDAVNRTKQRQLSALANAYVSARKLNNIPCRFDVVEVWLQNASTPTCALHQNAFDYQE